MVVLPPEGLCSMRSSTAPEGPGAEPGMGSTASAPLLPPLLLLLLCALGEEDIPMASPEAGAASARVSMRMPIGGEALVRGEGAGLAHGLNSAEALAFAWAVRGVVGGRGVGGG